MAHDYKLAVISFGDSLTFTAGGTRDEVQVNGSSVHGACSSGGKVGKPAMDTTLSLSLSKSKLALQILDTNWKITKDGDFPNDTATHRARNYGNCYKNMPTGKNLRCVLPFAKFTANLCNDSVSMSHVVMLDLKKDATSNAWEQNLTRTYGPFGENGTGFSRAGDFSAGATQVRLTFVDSTAASAFVASLANHRAPPEANTGEGKEIVNNHLPFEGKSFVFTGDSSDREKLERRVADLGGKVTSAVSGRTSYLMAYDKTTNKYKKADDLQKSGKPGPEILTDEVKLIALLDDADAVKAAADAEVECREPNGKRARICEQ